MSRIIHDPSRAERVNTSPNGRLNDAFSFVRVAATPSLMRAAVTLPIQRNAVQRPSQADKNRRSAGPAARRLGRRELHARVTSAAVRSCHCVLVAAAAAPLPGAGV